MQRFFNLLNVRDKYFPRLDDKSAFKNIFITQSIGGWYTFFKPFFCGHFGRGKEDLEAYSFFPIIRF